jgi:hypothetical protein
MVVIQRQLGHANLGITSVYLGGSTAARSSRPSTRARRQRFRRPPVCGQRSNSAQCRFHAKAGAPRCERSHRVLETTFIRDQARIVGKRARLVSLAISLP